MNRTSLGTAATNPSGWPTELLPLFEKAITTEFASLTKRGDPLTFPLTPYIGADGRTLDVSTGLTYPSKAERARRNPKVCLAYTFSVGTRLSNPPLALVYGLATVRDHDLQANTDHYIRVSFQKLPHTYSTMPAFMLKRMAWYFARIWICVTPVRIVWWPGGDLNHTPQVWYAPEGTAAPPSDPAPTGDGLGAWMEPPQDWREGAAYAVRALGTPVLTVVDSDGWPVPLRTLGASATPDGFRLTLGTGMPLSPNGRACLTFHTHAAHFDGQENMVFVGSVTTEGTTAQFSVERRIGDWSLKGNLLTKSLGFLNKGRALRPRLEAEAARRGQRVPTINLPR